jgi:hypothetical protein
LDLQDLLEGKKAGLSTPRFLMHPSFVLLKKSFVIPSGEKTREMRVFAILWVKKRRAAGRKRRSACKGGVYNTGTRPKGEGAEKWSSSGPNPYARRNFGLKGLFQVFVAKCSPYLRSGA